MYNAISLEDNTCFCNFMELAKSRWKGIAMIIIIVTLLINLIKVKIQCDIYSYCHNNKILIIEKNL